MRPIRSRLMSSQRPLPLETDSKLRSSALGLYRLALALLPVVLLGACATQKLEDFATGRPELRLETYFPGHTRAWGMFVDRFGTVRRQFIVDLDGGWDGTVLTLDEHFIYADGERQERHWRFHRDGAGGWIGTAPDVIGQAHGREAGNAFEMHYTAELRTGDSTLRADFDDWLFRQDQEVVLNRAVMRKFGVTLGTVQLAFRHDSPPATP